MPKTTTTTDARFRYSDGKNNKMAPYDSDSDDGYEPQDYTETDVLLGYVSKDSKGETISRLGGRPVSLPLPP